MNSQCTNGKLIFQFHAPELQYSHVLHDAENCNALHSKIDLIQATTSFKLPRKAKK